jgi:hypothetical protein
LNKCGAFANVLELFVFVGHPTQCQGFFDGDGASVKSYRVSVFQSEGPGEGRVAETGTAEQVAEGRIYCVSTVGDSQGPPTNPNQLDGVAIVTVVQNPVAHVSFPAVLG